MPNVMTAMQLFQAIMAIEGKRLGYLEAAQYIQNNFVAGDLDQPMKTLRCKLLFDTVVPQDVLCETAMELRAKAAEMERQVKAMMAQKYESDIVVQTKNAAAPRRPSKRPQLMVAADDDRDVMAG